MQHTIDHYYHACQNSYSEFLESNYDGTCNQLSIIGQMLATKISNKMYTLKEMMKQPDRVDFEKAMYKEVKHMFDNKVWEKVPQKEMIDYYKSLKRQGIDVKRKQLMLIWSFKQKRHADGSLNKHKARLCCHGGQRQWGVNYYETYAPVVAWASVRTMLIMLKLYNLNTRSIDFVLAYPQAN
eukprot:13058082-Ditylum_brightwellii.AAC.1